MLDRSEWPINTDPENYVIKLVGKVKVSKGHSMSPSACVLQALQMENPEVKAKGFKKAVLEAIFDDGFHERYMDKEYEERLLKRLIRFFGKDNARKLIINGCDILDTWNTRDAKMVPDAYLIDAKNRTVVCYEIEDSHPLNPNSIGSYANAWWNLEYIYWDLHLIAYDIYGHHRIIVYPEAGSISEHVRGKRNVSEEYEE